MSRKHVFRKDNLLQLGAIILTLAVFGAAVFAVSRMLNSRNETDTLYTRPDNRPKITYNGKDYVLRNNLESILVMGIDETEDLSYSDKFQNYTQADVIMLFVIDRDNNTYRCLQLNRDSMVPVNRAESSLNEELVTMQLALAHSFGTTDQARCENTVEAVSGMLFDLPIDHYVSLRMESIPILNDSVGGVTVTIPAGMEPADPAFTEGATVTLHGDQAERFVRSRMSLDDDSNTFRMERQRQFITKWRELAVARAEQNSDFVMDLNMQLSDYLVTDMFANSLSDFVSQLTTFTDGGIVTTEGEYEHVGAFREYYVDMDDLEAKVIDLFYEEA